MQYRISQIVFKSREQVSCVRYTVEYNDGLAPGSAILEYKAAEELPFLDSILQNLSPAQTVAEISTFHPMGLDRKAGPIRSHFGQGIGDELLDAMLSDASAHARVAYAMSENCHMQKLLQRNGFRKDSLLGICYAKVI